MQVNDILKILEAPELKVDTNLEEFIDIVKSNFRRLVKQHHPDKGGDPKKAVEVITAFSEFKQLVDNDQLKPGMIIDAKVKDNANWENEFKEAAETMDSVAAVYGSIGSVLRDLDLGGHQVYYKGYLFTVVVSKDTGSWGSRIVDNKIYRIINSKTRKILSLPEDKFTKILQLQMGR